MDTKIKKLNELISSQQPVSQPAESTIESIQSLNMVRTGPWPPVLGTVLLLLMFTSLVAALFVPWRQSVVGSGEIMVFSPMQRPQTLEAQISGRLTHWYVRDGQTVKQGQLIAELSDIDPRFLDHTQLSSLVAQKASLVEKRDAARARITSLGDQLANLTQSREAAVPAADERIGQSRDRLYAAQQSVDVAEQNVRTTEWQLTRISALFDKGLRSQRDQQVATLDNTRAKTELQRAKSAYDVVKKDLEIAGFDYKRVSADTQGSINSIKAALADANQVIASTSADISHLDIDIENMSERIQQRAIRSPAAGKVVRLNRVGTGETVTAGTVLATVVPTTDDRAAAIWVRDYDAPLLSVGRPVRLAISGWPALQFVGSPSVAVGTFAGRIAVIDAVDDGKHHYRVIVVPDHDAIAAKKEQPWPSPKYLRPGAQTTGWVLLSNVPLWYELWRQFNGFQPTVPAPETDSQVPDGDSH